jgi:TolB-like protein/Flp pilus assembly protein TadD
MKRRLAAIMAADVVGYSRLIRADEEGTIAALKALRADLIDPKIAEHHGRIVKLMGDGMLAEFASVVDAVHAAVETQQAMTDHNSGLPENKRIEFRVGINLGDVVIDGDDIHGDGVNVAARLEGLAEPGGVCVSGMVYEAVRDRIDFPFEDLGEQEVKNIDRPVRVWRWRPSAEGSAAGSVAAEEPLPLPDKPSIAVLPFDNLSGDPEQEYFADGITEDIITELSRFHWFLVIARNSSFTYKGQAVKIGQIGQELGVRYVIEGSVRKAGNQVRVTAQLIDAATGAHVWADRYDRDLDEIFAVQDEIAQSITASIAPEFLGAEMARAQRRGPRDLTSWDLYLRAMWLASQLEEEAAAEALQLLNEAIEIDPQNSQIHSELALVHLRNSQFGWGSSPAESIAEATRAAQKAVSLDKGDALAHASLGVIQVFAKRHDEAVRTLKHAISVNPNLAVAHAWLGSAHAFACRYEPAVEAVQRALRLSPRDPYKPFWLLSWAIAAFAVERYEEAIEQLQEILREMPNVPSALRWLASCYSAIGREDMAHATCRDLLRLLPESTVELVRAQVQIKAIKEAAVLNRYLDGLRKAGLPE